MPTQTKASTTPTVVVRLTTPTCALAAPPHSPGPLRVGPLPGRRVHEVLWGG